MTNQELQAICERLGAAGVLLEVQEFDVDGKEMGFGVDYSAELRVNYCTGYPTLRLESPDLAKEFKEIHAENFKAQRDLEKAEEAKDELESLQQKVKELLACVDKVNSGQADWIADLNTSLLELSVATEVKRAEINREAWAEAFAGIPA